MVVLESCDYVSSRPRSAMLVIETWNGERWLDWAVGGRVGTQLQFLCVPIEGVSSSTERPSTNDEA